MWSVFKHKASGVLVAVNDEAWAALCSDKWELLKDDFCSKESALQFIEQKKQEV